MNTECVYGLNIGYWNIDGLRPKHTDKTKDSEFIKFINTNDITAIGETHLSEEKVLSFDNYKIISIFRPRTKNVTRDFGGISVFIKKTIFKGVSVIKKKKETNFIWICIKKEYLHRNQDLYLGFVHVPHEHSTYFDKLEYNVMDMLCEDIIEHKRKGQVVVMGDFNGRVGNLQDFIKNDTGDHLPIPDDYLEDTLTKHRNHYDKIINNRGHEIIDLCLSANLRIMNGRMLGDLLGNFTCFKNGVSTIDYCLVEQNVLRMFATFVWKI
jgi:exonuclease III